MQNINYLKPLLISILYVFILSSCSQINLLKSESLNDYQEKYVVGSDIPLFKGLKLIDSDSASFDSTLGDISASKYIGDFESDEVKEFYLETLPHLGWNLIKNDGDDIVFKRDNDKLEIKFKYASKGIYVRFFVLTLLKTI